MDAIDAISTNHGKWVATIKLGNYYPLWIHCHCLRRYLTLQIIPQSHFLRRYGWIHRDHVFSCQITINSINSHQPGLEDFDGSPPIPGGDPRVKKMKMLINHRYNVVLIVVANRCHWLLVMLVLMVINVDELTCS